MTTSSQALDKVKGKAVSLAKKKLTATATDVSSKLQDRLKNKLTDKLSSSAKAATSATSVVSGALSMEAINQKLSTQAISNALKGGGALKSGAAKAISSVTDKLTKAKTPDLKGLLKSKVSGLMGSKVDALLEGEAKINEKLAPTLVTTGPNDKLLTVDAYDYSPKDIFSKFAGKLSDEGKGIFDSLGGGGGMAATVAGLLKKGTSGGFSLDTDQLKNRLIGAVGGKTGAINKLSEGFKSAVGQATGIPAQLLNRADVVINGVTRSIATGDIKSASTLFDLVGTVVNDSQLVNFLDVGAKTSLLSQVMREAMELGVPEAIDIVVSKANANDKSALYALGSVVDTAVTTGNVSTVQLMVNNLGRDVIVSQYPQAVPQILASYAYTKDPVEANMRPMYDELLTVLRGIDPNWDKYNRNGEWVTNLNAFSGISNDARTLFSRYGEFSIAVLLGPQYPQTTILTQLKTMYPQTTFGY